MEGHYVPFTKGQELWRGYEVRKESTRTHLFHESFHTDSMRLSACVAKWYILLENL
jgi:hypothetical protein